MTSQRTTAWKPGGAVGIPRSLEATTPDASNPNQVGFVVNLLKSESFIVWSIFCAILVIVSKRMLHQLLF